jgi:hypothetical protein
LKKYNKEHHKLIFNFELGFHFSFGDAISTYT